MLRASHLKPLIPNWIPSTMCQSPIWVFSHRDWGLTAQKASHYPLSIAVSHEGFGQKRQRTMEYHTG